MGTLLDMAGSEPVPEADRLEQEMPPARDEREGHPVPPEAPEADVLEQETPVELSEGETGIDAERIEPLGDEDRGTSSPP